MRYCTHPSHIEDDSMAWVQDDEPDHAGWKRGFKDWRKPYE